MRVDASEQIGTGHFMRCLTLADELGQRGAKCQFLSRGLPDDLSAMAGRKGHVVTALAPRIGCATARGPEHADWLGASQQDDAEDTMAALGGGKARWLVIDHYAIDAQWHAAVRSHADRILVIDDLADRLHACDVLLDQNLHDDMKGRYASKVPTHCRMLLGPRYALLRKEFREASESRRSRDGTIRRVLVLMGGIDRARLTLTAIEALAPLSDSLQVDVVISSQNRARQEVTEACRLRKFALHVQPPDLAGLMRAADLSIGAAGSTTWERCCMGLPTICITEAVNQVPIAKALDSAGAAISLGDKARVRASDLTTTVRSLIAQPRTVASMALAASKLVDGVGAERVADILLEYT